MYEYSSVNTLNKQSYYLLYEHWTEHPSCKREVVGSYPTRHGAGPWIFRFISQWTVTSVRLPACMLGWPSSPPTRLIKRSTPSAHTLGAEFAHMWTACTVYSTFTTMCPPPHPTFIDKSTHALHLAGWVPLIAHILQHTNSR